MFGPWALNQILINVSSLYIQGSIKLSKKVWDITSSIIIKEYNKINIKIKNYKINHNIVWNTIEKLQTVKSIPH